MGKYAWVTLATNDSYSLGALVVAYSLKRVQTAHELAVLVTVGVSDSMKKKLSNVFDLVEEVNVLDSQDSAHLALLSRPELGVTFTKLHCWRLTQYEKCVFLDADTLILLNCDELFEREELSAAPDVGWPDCFNSGVFVYRPNLETYDKLLEFAVKDGSFDGGDQGLLNSYFSDWSTKDISKHLPFIYNTTTTAVYSYIPAFKKFGENVKILHFIGKIKPWLQIFDSASKTVRTPEGYHHVAEFLQFWWNIFCDDIHPQLSPDMSGIAGALAQLRLGEPCANEHEMYMRRQSWESGNVDYLGKDSFDNIWRRITQTLESGPKQESPEKETTPQRESTPQPELKTSKVDAQKKEVTLRLTTTIEEKEEETSSTTTQCEKNVIAVCSPRELMRTLSSPGLAQEQIITTVTPEGKTVIQKILTYPEREIEIEDYERIEILGPVTRKVTTETTRICPGKPADTQVVVQQSQTKTDSSNKLSLNMVLPTVPGDKLEFDEKTNTTTITRKTPTGYEMIISTITPDGRTRVQTKSFFDPVEVVSTTETKTTQQQQQQKTVSEEVKKVVETKQQTVPQPKPQPQPQPVVKPKVDEKTNTTTTTTTTKVDKVQQQDVGKKDTKTTTVVQQPAKPGEEKTTVTVEKTPTGRKEIYTTIRPDGTTKTQTKTFYDPVEIPGDEEEIEEYEEEHTEHPVVKTKTTTTYTTKPVTSTTDTKKTTTADSNKTTTVQKVDKTATAVPAKIDETKVSKVDNTKTTKTTKVTETTTTAVQKTSELAAQKTTAAKTTQQTPAPVVAAPKQPVAAPPKTTTVAPKTTTATTAVDKNVTEKTSAVKTTQVTTTTTTKTSESVAKKAVEQTSKVDASKKTTGVVGKGTTTTTKTTTTPVTTTAAKGEPKTIVTTKRVGNGTEKTITTINPDGTKKVETKTVFDPVELSGSEEEEEEYEEYEEEIEEPVVTKITTKTTTTPVTKTTATTQPAAAGKGKVGAVTPTPAPVPVAKKVATPVPVAQKTSTPEPVQTKKKLGSAAASPSATAKPTTPVTADPVAPPRKKEVKKVTTPLKK